MFILGAVFLYFSVAQRRNAHLTVTLLTSTLESMGPEVQRAAEYVQVIAMVISLVFMLAVVWWGLTDVEDNIKYGSRSESLAFPMWPFLVTLLLGFAFMAITMIFQVYRGIQHLRGKRFLDDAPDEIAGDALH